MLETDELDHLGLVARTFIFLFLLTGLICLLFVVRAQSVATIRRYLRAAENDLVTSKERFERALQGASCGLWEWNFRADAFWLSPRFKELLGYADDEIDNTLTTWRAALHRDDRPRAMAALGNHVFDLGAYDAEYRLRTKSGEYRWFHVRGLTIRDPSGNPYLLSGSIQDIHERKTAEIAIRRHDDYLRRKQKMEALGQLAGGVAHEFNNVLQGISGCIQFARRSDAPPTVLEELATADGLVRQATALTRQLLDLSRPKPIDLKPIDTADFLNAAGVVLKAMLPIEIEFRIEIEPRTPRIMADSTQLLQALVNLCINAKDAMAGEGFLAVRAQEVEDTNDGIPRSSDLPAGPYVAIAVSDSGCGIPVDVQSRIFEPFFTTKDSARGTGLGLAITYGIVRDHRGSIRVDSEPGRGSTFTILIPAAVAADDKPLSRAAPPPKDPRWLTAIHDDYSPA